MFAGGRSLRRRIAGREIKFFFEVEFIGCCDSSIWIMFMENLEHLELDGALKVHGACDKVTNHMRKERIV